MKLIKFDLPIDGTKVRNIEELRDHFNTEILDLHKSGLLAKWLRSQRQPDLLAQVKAIAENSSDQARLDALCRVFSIELDSEIIQQLTQLHDQGIKRGGIRIDPLQIEYESFHEKYTDFTEKFKKYERFLEYCKQFYEKDTIDVAEQELIKMMHFIIKDEALYIKSCLTSCRENIDYSKVFVKRKFYPDGDWYETLESPDGYLNVENSSIVSSKIDGFSVEIYKKILRPSDKACEVFLKINNQE